MLATKGGICVPQPLKPICSCKRKSQIGCVSAARSFMNSSVNPSAESSSPYSDQAQTSVQAATGLTRRPKPQPKLPQMGQQRTGSNRFRLSEPMCTERLAWFVVATAPATKTIARYVGGNRWDRNQRRPTGSDHEFGQESPEFRTRTSVGGLSYWATRRQVAPSDCWVWEPEKLSRDLPATARPAPEDEQVRE